MVAALTALAAMLIGAVAISSWFAVQANKAKVLAERKTDEALSEKQKAIGERMNADAARKEAASNEQLARLKTNEVIEESKKTKKQLVRFYVANGMRFAESNAPWEALSWYAKAWESEPDKDLAWESAHRMRIGSVMADAPKLAAVFFHENMVFDAVLSPDGMRLVTIPENDEAWLFDVASQTPIGRLKHDGTVFAAAFSPDGTTLVTGGKDRKLKFWDSASGRSLGNDILLSEDVRSIDFHPNLPLVAIAAGEASVWDVRTRQKIALVEAPKNAWHVKFSDDGMQLVIAFERLARVWNTTDWVPVGASMQHTGLAVNSMAGFLQKRVPSRDKPFPSLSPDGKNLVVFSAKGPQIVELPSGDKTSLSGHGSSINSAEFSSDGKHLLVCGYEQKVNIYSAESWELTKSFPTPRAVLQATWHPSLPIIIATSAGGVTHLIDAVTGEAMAPTLKHAVSTSRVGFTPDGKRALVADLDGTVRLWEFRPPSQVSIVDPATIPGLIASLSPNGTLRARTIANGSGIVLVDAKTGATVSKTAGVDQTTELTASDENVFFSPDGKFILTCKASDLQIWNALNCQHVTTVKGAIDEVAPRSWLRFSNDGSRFLAVDRSRTIGIYETRTGNPVGTKIPSPPESELRTVSISFDGTKWAMGGTNSQADVFDSATGEKLVSVTHRGFIAGISFCENNELFATASLDNTCRVWDVRTGNPVSPPLRHGAYAWGVKFSPNAMQVATCSQDQKVRLWDIRTGMVLATATVLSSGSFLEISNQGESVFFVGADGKYRRWTIPTFDGSSATYSYLSRLITGRYVDHTDGFTEIIKSEFTDNIVSYRSAWFDYLKQPVPEIPSRSPDSKSSDK